MARRPMWPSRWCCSRPPAPPLTSSAISRRAATLSARWCWRCRGSFRRSEGCTAVIRARASTHTRTHRPSRYGGHEFLPASDQQIGVGGRSDLVRPQSVTIICLDQCCLARREHSEVDAIGCRCFSGGAKGPQRSFEDLLPQRNRPVPGIKINADDLVTDDINPVLGSPNDHLGAPNALAATHRTDIAEVLP